MLAQPDHLENFTKSLAANPRHFSDVGTGLSVVATLTLIVWERDDRFTPMDSGQHLSAGLPNARLHVFSHCGHWLQWEYANAFNRLVLDSLSN